MVPDVHRFLLRSTQVLDLRRAAEVDMSAIRMLSKSPAVDAAVDQTRSEVEPDDPEAGTRAPDRLRPTITAHRASGALK